ncbi:BON domain-containing protein [Sphingopyxis sp.]|uniref:BON domain-containing protein n=1 Tax=Sphingopyxis sp. TaxID=1908224 RepID=UPI003BA9DD26
MTRTDSELQHDVIAELEWEARVDHAHIGVAVDAGVVTLSGHVASYPEKMAAEKAVGRVAGVKALAEEIEVRLASDPGTSDREIARRIVEMIGWTVGIPDGRIRVKVERGWVTLSGSVDWNFQRREVFKVAGRAAGVVEVSNLIVVRELPTSADVQKRIVLAFKRQANLDAGGIEVITDGGTVTLRGHVRAWGERAIAESAAWSAPGVTSVEDYLAVR